MKTIILAGGKGSRMGSTSKLIPKPLTLINGKPIIMHIIQHFGFYGHKEFIICTGYLANSFINYFEKICLKKETINDNTIEFSVDDCKITTLYTGDDAGTGERIVKAFNQISDNEVFMTYGDGLSDISIDDLYSFHCKRGSLITLTAVHPPQRFGLLSIGDDGLVENFSEKIIDKNTWINGGYMVLKRDFVNIAKLSTGSFERDVIPEVAKKSLVFAYKHEGFWQCMDTLTDRIQLERVLSENPLPWMHK